MKSISFVKLFCYALLYLSMLACAHKDLDNDVQAKPTEEKRWHTCKMALIGGVNGFNQSESNKALSSSWQNGDKIYVAFYKEMAMVQGVAVYDSSFGWTVSYNGDLVEGSNQKCEVRFFVNATFANSNLVSISPHTEIYEDVNGFYSYSQDTLTIHALLVPKTGRIRFTGASGTKIYLVGITTYSSYAPANNQFASMSINTETVSELGSTPYVYGYFIDNNRSMCIIGDSFAFTRNCTEEVLKVGKSGYMAIPSQTSHNNWEQGAYITRGDGLSKIQMKMIPVAGHTGGFFLMMETEITEQIWNIVEDTSAYGDSSLPKVKVSYEDMCTFIRKINDKTGLNFSLPTKSQWQYAAKGGDKSQGYIYAGSNMPGGVAWYVENTASRQSVKTKIPNELGLYDMSGNVSELTLEDNPSSFAYGRCGGSYLDQSADITTESYKNYFVSYASYSMGFRLILTCP